ncbi:MAG: two-component system response regulator FixJ [Granulosicoccus sp.]|jgi:FixJ family two-component response regulator
MHSKEQTIFVVDDDDGIREALGLMLDTIGLPYELFESGIDFLAAYDADRGGCLVLDVRMPNMTGLDVQLKLNELESSLPIIFITGHGDIPMAVEAMRRGALDFIRKPFREQDILDRINEALEFEIDSRKAQLNRRDLASRIATLSERENTVFHSVAAGVMNKVIALELGISERTVEVHRSQIMKKLNVRTLAQLVRIKLEMELLSADKVRV